MIQRLGIVTPLAPHQTDAKMALKEGAERHGVSVHMIERTGVIPHIIKHVACWGWRLGQVFRARGYNVLVIERGYLGDRFGWVSLGWNGLNGRAWVPVPDDDGRRFRLHFRDLMRPWAPQGRYVLIAGQVYGDAALDGMSLQKWYENTAWAARTCWGLPVRFRPHPVALRRGDLESVKGAETMKGSLEDALAGARAVATFNSNVGVDAIMAGKPTIATDPGSMAWTVAAHAVEIADAEPAREAWGAKMAWRQWTLDEIRNGYAWDVVSSEEIP